MTTSNHLFAYGTLMAAAGNAVAGSLGGAERSRLARNGQLLGGATMAGLLYDLGRYPGLKTEIGVGALPTRVAGELWLLEDVDATLRWLDRYEGIDPARPDESEYRRLILPARRSDGEVVQAWVFVWAGDASRARLIECGDWLAR